MIYKKSDNKRYVDMAMEFDKEFYEDEVNDFKLFKYLYLIFYMLACKKKLFTRFEDFDKFSQFSARTIYIRMLKKKKEGERIKSILNYCKETIKYLKIMYQNESFQEVIDPEFNKNFDSDKYKGILRDSVRETYEEPMMLVAVEEDLGRIGELIKEALKSVPYKDALTLKNLKISVMLTLLNEMTLPISYRNYMDDRASKGKWNDDMFISALDKERNKPPLLWKLDSSMSDYVKLKCNQVRQLLNESINATVDTYSMPEESIDEILSSGVADALQYKE